MFLMPYLTGITKRRGAPCSIVRVRRSSRNTEAFESASRCPGRGQRKDALARWTAVVEREASAVVSPVVRDLVVRNLQEWKGELMPISRSWVEAEVSVLTGQDRAMARLALMLAKAPYQVDKTLVEEVLREDWCEERFVRILAWASFSGARRFAQRIAEGAGCFEGQGSVCGAF
jgi:hypothetical protein